MDVNMDPRVLGAVIIGVVVLALAGWVIWQRQRSERLQRHYGQEYQRTVSELGRRRAEAELERRAQRVRQLDIHPLSAEQREQFSTQWRAVQTAFVDNPPQAVSEADRLVEATMRARGYPIDDFESRVNNLSVDHPRVVHNYRLTREIAVRHRRGEASTEDLRKAMVYYRELFEDLLEDRPVQATERIVDRPVQPGDRIEPAAARPDVIRPADREVRP